MKESLKVAIGAYRVERGIAMLKSGPAKKKELVVKLKRDIAKYKWGLV